MKFNKRFIFFLSFFILQVSVPLLAKDLPIQKIKLPPGFQIEIFAENVPNARGMALGKKGTVFVGSRRAGRVYALRDLDGDGRPEKIQTIALGLRMPVGVAFYKGDLYVSEINRVLRFKSIESHLDSQVTPEVVNGSFPDEVHHGWKFIKVGPDEKIYVPVGAPCNACEKKDKRYATIMRMNLDGSSLEVFASGVRNTVGFDWHPATKEMWFTDNGRDQLGDDLPPDELNHAPTRGLHFGFPYCHGGFFLDPEWGKGKSCNDFKAPAMKLGPHVAALGMRFYKGKAFPKEYQGQIFIAEHGSWNRSKKIGYRITWVRIENNKAVHYETFAEGWLQGEKAWGRPVDILNMPDGSILISDDHAGVIYRVSYKRPTT